MYRIFTQFKRRNVKTNEELLAEANKIDFKFTAQGHISRKHTEYELGLYIIKRAIERHGIEKYLYGKVRYINAKAKTTVVCPLHGDFEINPNNLTNGKGCAKCSNVHQPSTEEWIKKAQKVHGTQYDYSDVVYKHNKSKIQIICKKHGPFYQTPSNHLTGYGCNTCARELVAKGHTHTKEQFIAKAKEVHGEKYNYDKVDYINARQHVCIICPYHGSFLQSPDAHSGGSGCPKCAGKFQDILYIFRCLDTGWYKIGITTRDTKNRIKHLGGRIEEVYNVECEDPRKHEGVLHKRYADIRKNNPHVRNGNTEFFSLTEEQVQEVINYMKELK